METWERLRRLDVERPWLLDAVLAALLFTGAAVSAAVGDPTRPPDRTYLLLVAVGALPYAVRRLAPLPVLLLASVAVLTVLALGYTSAVIGSGLFLAVYTVAAWRSARQTAVAAAYVVVLLALLVVVAPQKAEFGEMATNAALFAGAIAFGRSMNDRRRTTALLADRAELAERARAEEARRAISEERLRIAQELHDVVGHSLGVIALQAQVGAHVLEEDPAEARAALVAVSQTSRSALGEVRRILGALRTDGEGYRPQPGLDDLEDLAAELRAAGVPVELRMTGSPDPVPAALALTAYRLVQESLTNVVRHAGGAAATVTVTRGAEALDVEVTDDGPPAPRPRGMEAPGGHGQLGMRERVAVWGGTLEAGPRPDGGYRVHAVLPLEEARSR
ncbi:histidine kinase [Actinotalea ferrariae CF5-4]|uniref:histidine kinase n=1 Tax=Actinotalea ferrariae CF5-4 TaxID=948458 RepID=A0A021VQL8_9CELL|nr:sensor histidine kinase [Actinotalea ferrariae]EYR63436.1 histidine kinase [Actinotalea ferrariae CF5-4]